MRKIPKLEAYTKKGIIENRQYLSKPLTINSFNLFSIGFALFIYDSNPKILKKIACSENNFSTFYKTGSYPSQDFEAYSQGSFLFPKSPSK